MGDLEFLQSCLKGDKQSWNQFVSKYSRLIYNYIYEVLNLKGRTSSEQNIKDIYQELFYTLIKEDFRKLKTFKAKNGCSLASWLRQVTINFTIDYLRKAKPAMVSIEEELDTDFALKDTLKDNSIPLNEIVSSQEKLNVLKECIENLDLDDKYFLELFINKQLKLEELRGLLRISRGAVDMRKSRIVNRLRECFKSKHFELDF